jgi:hypothetical protein
MTDLNRLLEQLDRLARHVRSVDIDLRLSPRPELRSGLARSIEIRSAWLLRAMRHHGWLDDHAWLNDSDYFGEDGNIQKINTWGQEIATIDSKLSVTEILSCDNDIITGANFFAAAGHVFTSEAANFGFVVGELKDEALQQTKEYLKEIKDFRDDELSTQADETYQQLDDDFYQDGKAGNDESIKSAGFSFRKTSEYGTDSFILFDSRWQTMARQGNDGVPWTEKAVKQGDQETYPFPGKEAMIDNEALRTVQATLYTPSSGLAKNRSSGLFENPVLPSPQNRNLQGTYLITG